MEFQPHPAPLSTLASPKRPRPPYQHHAGFYRAINPGDDLSRPWQGTPRSEGCLPMSPSEMKPVFNLPETLLPQHRYHPVLPDPLEAHRHRNQSSSSAGGSQQQQHSPNTSLGSSSRSRSSKLGRENEFGFVVGTIPVPSSAIELERSLEEKRSRKKGLWRRILRFFRRSGAHRSNPPQVSHEPIKKSTPEPTNPYAEKVPLNEWKQYGYWARPFINDLQCENSPVTSEKSLTTEALAELIKNMREPEDQGGAARPDRWLKGAKHRALPSRPARWAKDPDPDTPLPFPWEVQVNPLLQHLLWGPPPLNWCIFADPYTNLWFGRTPFKVPCGDGDRAQPATWPFLTAMHFNAVLGDHAYKFPWPFTVHNPRGIKVGDVLAEIHYCFKQPVLEDERSSWDMIRQDAARKTLAARCNWGVEQGYPPIEDSMRRCDALGAIMWFRGIEPAVNGSGWMIAFGTY